MTPTRNRFLSSWKSYQRFSPVSGTTWCCSQCTGDWDVHFGHSSSEPLQLPEAEANGLRGHRKEGRMWMCLIPLLLITGNYLTLRIPPPMSSFCQPAGAKAKAKLKVLITKKWVTSSSMSKSSCLCHHTGSNTSGCTLWCTQISKQHMTSYHCLLSSLQTLTTGMGCKEVNCYCNSR